MDHRYEDVSDCDVDDSFFDSNVEEEVQKNGTTTKPDGEESSEISQTADTVESDCNLNLETKVVEGDRAKEERQEKENEKENENENEEEKENEKEAEQDIPNQVSQTDKKCEENYYTDEEDSSDDNRKQKVGLKLSKQSKVSKDIAVNSTSSSSSPSSSSCNSQTDCSDTDSDGCLSNSASSSSKKNGKSKLALLSPKQKSAPEIKSVEVKPRPNAEESEDTVTDVTPLSTPDISPIQNFEVAASSDNMLKVKSHENVNLALYEPELDHGCQQMVLNEAVGVNDLFRAFLQLEQKEPPKRVLDQSSLRPRKNSSFTNEEVRQTDRENQRLVKELSKHTTKPRSKSASVKRPSGPTSKMYHSAINRQREQERIARENVAFVKRLEAVKPTAGLRRSEQLLDYQRQMSYFSAAPTPRRGKSALSHHSPSHASHASRHSASSTISRRSVRPVFDSSCGALQRPNPSNIRHAWL